MNKPDVLTPRTEEDPGWRMLPRWLRHFGKSGDKTYAREMARRRRQMERGILNAENRGV